MALTLPLPEVPESRVYNSLGSQSATLLVIPGAADYPTGGYVITAAQCRMSRIIAVSIDGWNTTFNALGFLLNVVLGYTLSSAGLPLPPTQFNLYAANIVASVVTQLANGTSLAGSVIALTVTGY